jgi:hypothetical protein
MYTKSKSQLGHIHYAVQTGCKKRKEKEKEKRKKNHSESQNNDPRKALV